MNAWKNVLDYFNMREGQVVKRQEFINDVAGNQQSLETYRCYLTRAGYLQSVGPGRYFVRRALPSTLTITQVYAKAYPKKKAK